MRSNGSRFYCAGSMHTARSAPTTPTRVCSKRLLGRTSYRSRTRIRFDCAAEALRDRGQLSEQEPKLTHVEDPLPGHCGGSREHLDIIADVAAEPLWFKLMAIGLVVPATVFVSRTRRRGPKSAGV